MDKRDWFRKPDEKIGNWAIWYGIGGKLGDCATTVESNPWGYEVCEYQHVDGLIEQYGKEAPFLRVCTNIEKAQNHRHAATLGTNRISQQGGAEDFVANLGD